MTLDEEVQMAGAALSEALLLANAEIAPVLDDLKKRIWRLEDALLGVSRHRPLVEQVVSYAAFLFRVRRDDIIGPGRRADIAQARFAVVWAVKRVRPDYSYPRIGRALGDRDHSTITAAERRANALREADLGFRASTDKMVAAFSQKDSEEAHPCLF